VLNLFISSVKYSFLVDITRTYCVTLAKELLTLKFYSQKYSSCTLPTYVGKQEAPKLNINFLFAVKMSLMYEYTCLLSSNAIDIHVGNLRDSPKRGNICTL
jgi:hypothetical protein